MVKIIFLGPPGSGKGTLAKKLSEEQGFWHISAGDLLREEVFKKTSLAEKINEYLKKGALVPDEIVVLVIKNKILASAAANFVLDGFPRSLSQEKALEKMFRAINSQIDGVVYFQVSEDEAVARLSGRLNCPKCGAVYHAVNKPPQKDKICDVCGSELFVREDDQPVTIKNRYEVYQKQTKPLVEYFSKKKLLSVLTATGTIEQVYQNLSGILNKISR